MLCILPTTVAFNQTLSNILVVWLEISEGKDELWKTFCKKNFEVTLQLQLMYTINY